MRTAYIEDVPGFEDALPIMEQIEQRDGDDDQQDTVSDAIDEYEKMADNQIVN